MRRNEKGFFCREPSGVHQTGGAHGGTAVPGFHAAVPLRKASLALVPETVPACRSRSVSIRHLPEMQEWQARLDREGRLSANPTWRKYIGSFRYSAPTALANARSLVIMALPLKIARIVFHIGRTKSATS